MSDQTRHYIKRKNLNPHTIFTVLQWPLVHRRVVVLTLFVCTPLLSAEVSFTSADIGLDPGGTSRGVAWGDFDNDGWPDLAIGNTDEEPLGVYRNVGGERLERITGNPALDEKANAQGLNWIDIDNDGDLDLFVARERGPNLLLRNDSGQLVRADAGALTDDTYNALQGCWSDVDNDGYLDVYVVHNDDQPDHLYRNIDGRSFEVVNGPWSDLANNGRSCAWGDVDNNGRDDLYVANARMSLDDRSFDAPNNLYLNTGNTGTGFEQITSGEPVNFHSYAYGVSFADVDFDGDDDLFVSSIGRYDPNMLFENIEGKWMVPNRRSVIVHDRPGPVKGHAWGDFDNDGDLDLYAAEGHGGARPEHAPFDNSDRLYLNSADDGFTIAHIPETTDHPLVSAGVASADVDRDGDLDLVIANWADAEPGVKQDNQFFYNDTGGRWIRIHLQGERSNRMGIGARVKITTSTGDDTRTQYRTLRSNSGYGSMSEPVIHFGLNVESTITQVEIRWPSGQIDRYQNVEGNQRYLAIENESLKRHEMAE